MGAKSFVLQSRSVSQAEGFGGATRNIAVGTGGDVEGDSIYNGSPFGKACTLSDLQIYITANTLSSDEDFEIYKNDTATGVKTTALASGNPTGWTALSTGTVSVAAGDRINVQVTNNNGSNAVSVNMLAFVVESDDTSAITLFNANAPSSSNFNADNATSYGKPAGQRGLDATEAIGSIEMPIAGTANYLYLKAGTFSRSSNSSVTFRNNAMDGNQTFSYGVTGYHEDSVNSDTISAGDDIALAFTNGSGSGEANNLEKYGFTLVNSSGLFANAKADADDLRQNDGLVRYYSISGSTLGNGETTADAAHYVLPFDVDVSQLGIHVTEELMSQDSTFTLHVDDGGGWTDVGTAITIPSVDGAGRYLQSQSLSLSAGDKICYKLDTSGSGTKLHIASMTSAMAEAAAGGGLSIPIAAYHYNHHFR